MTIALSATFLTAVILNIYAVKEILLKFLSHLLNALSLTAYIHIIDFITGIATSLSDILGFFAVVRQVWGLWIEKRRLGLQTKQDFVSVLLQQGILRFAFNNGIHTGIYLRRRNSEKNPAPNQSALELPTLLIQDNQTRSSQSIHILKRLHQSIIADMGEIEMDSSMSVRGQGGGREQETS
ncbi:hypothetical protein Clacol_004342 [Clathrus columnatus]|uniref:Uncharacterized protein n=1 Tax=Clathrus columnatus TaxID=1419009 RepID=A0AAV5AC96_9AGAM|nr:hypothetical protein Clacol_004342 [Clathrus columnatus]